MTLPTTVLVIDDQPWFLGIQDWRDYISDVHFEVVTDPTTVLPRDLSSVLLVMVDHRMPGMNGDAVAHHLRRQGFTLPIVKIGSFNEKGYPEDCIWVGKALSIRKVQALIDFARGNLDRDQLDTRLLR